MCVSVRAWLQTEHHSISWQQHGAKHELIAHPSSCLVKSKAIAAPLYPSSLHPLPTKSQALAHLECLEWAQMCVRVCVGGEGVYAPLTSSSTDCDPAEETGRRGPLRLQYNQAVSERYRRS